MRRTAARSRVPPQLRRFHDEYVRVAGEIASVAIEREPDERKIDHVWVEVRAGEFGRLQISLSTCSRQSLAANFDPRVRIGVITSAWIELPSAGVHSATALDYAALEGAHRVEYLPYERKEVEQLLLERTDRALFVEAWGEFYVRARAGVHQIHSRRGSFAVPEDHVGRDGALQLYFRDPHVREMFLFKFAGQP